MKLTCTSPAKSLNKAYLKQSVKREQIGIFASGVRSGHGPDVPRFEAEIDHSSTPSMD